MAWVSLISGVERVSLLNMAFEDACIHKVGVNDEMNAPAAARNKNFLAAHPTALEQCQDWGLKPLKEPLNEGLFTRDQSRALAS